MQKVMSRDCESRQTEVNLEHEIASPRRSVTSATVCDHRRDAQVEMNKLKRNITPISFRCDHGMCACVFTLDQLDSYCPTEDPNSENADMIVTTIHVQPAA
jgi:hypothetical protein